MKLKIVIIDDEESIRNTFRWHLQDMGHEVFTFAAPVECDVQAYCLCQQSTPCTDALLIDYNLPSMNGLDFIESLIKHGCKGEPRNILLMSGDTTRIDMKKAAALGCSVEQKPLSLETLERWISEVQLRKQGCKSAP
ncbi:response regulator [Deltaproteobacteria bacterium IMCC39524]|nr:response regulator [Deltaproteobacteria bacterium IMCC39524]